ncbi:ATP-binding protein [Dyadobacter sp. LHD-138]|uniref:HD domain-containing protein n=1 Tax=Dyadobacter sp. LHD-138 TaxID=3071413 RepID=UPI0027E08A32|nr:ATP-binding protein [Dyadobacter sp. LHD-138]MDQ6480251.1 ATP-binding protein [Dyadobacter sp. LHD-138]
MNTEISPQDQYKDEVMNRLRTSKLYNTFAERCRNNSETDGSKILAITEEAITYSYHRHKLVLRHMGEFTLHDSEHLFKVLRLMEFLIPDSTISHLSNPELMLLILAVFFHDIGMAPSEAVIRAWLGIDMQDFTDGQREEYEKFQRFVNGREDKKKEVDELRAQKNYAKAELVMRYLISEYIRITHAERAIEIIAEDWDGIFQYHGTDLTPQLALLCRSHNEDSIKLLDLDHAIPMGQGTYICVPFLGVVLRLADILDFDAKRTPQVLLSNLFISSPTSIKEWQKHRAIDNWTITEKFIGFKATCSHPAIESSIRKFCSTIDYELKSCSSVLSNLHDGNLVPFPDYYRIPLAPKVDSSRIKAEIDLNGKPKYLYRDTTFTLSKKQIIDLLMGTKLYGQTNIALRELLQNSIDTCLLRAKLEEFWGNSHNPELVVTFTRTDQETKLSVLDNGMGMDENIIDNFYSKIGKSYYKSSDFLELKSTLRSEYIPTSRFGIGILSCFMVSDVIEVETRRVNENHHYSDPLTLRIEGQDSIFFIQRGNKNMPGTSTTLTLRKDNPWSSLTDSQIVDFVKRTVPFPPFPIKIKVGSLTMEHRPISATEASIEDFKHQESPNFNLVTFPIILNGSKGIFGYCEATIIESNGIPVDGLNETSREFEINGSIHRFKSKLKIEPNKISSQYESIDIKSKPGEIKIKESVTDIKNSRSKLALHGIELPMSLFDFWNGDTYQRAKVNWPVCVQLNININGNRDINLNSARTEILSDEKWIDFEYTLCKEILSGVKNQVNVVYWNALKTILSSKVEGYSVEFQHALSEV